MDEKSLGPTQIEEMIKKTKRELMEVDQEVQALKSKLMDVAIVAVQNRKMEHELVRLANLIDGKELEIRGKKMVLYSLEHQYSTPIS